MVSKRDIAFVIGILFTIGITIAVFAIAYFRNVDPIYINYSRTFLPPFPFTGSMIEHPLGTDHLGRDILARLAHGGRITLSVAWISVLGAGLVGMLVGVICGYFEGYIDAVTMRFAEAVLAFPMIILSLLLVAVIVPGPETLVAIFVFAAWPHFAKIVRSAVLTLKHEEYVTAVRALGGSNRRIIFRHLLPNVVTVVTIVLPLQLTTIVYAEAGLSFIGVGIQPPAASWGSMLADGRNYILLTPWLVTLPGLCLLVVVLGANLLGDSLQAHFDPRRKSQSG